MGKPSIPAAPTPPDPYATARAQTGSNVNTAIANAFLNNVNQKSPWGTSTFRQIGSRWLPYDNSEAGGTSGVGTAGTTGAGAGGTAVTSMPFTPSPTPSPSSVVTAQNAPITQRPSSLPPPQAPVSSIDASAQQPLMRPPPPPPPTPSDPTPYTQPVEPSPSIAGRQPTQGGANDYVVGESYSLIGPRSAGNEGQALIGNPQGNTLPAGGYDIPLFEQEITLSPEQQRLYDQQVQLGGNLNNLAIGQVDRLGNVLNQPLTADGLPQGGSMPTGGPQFQSIGAGPQFQNVGLQNRVYPGASLSQNTGGGPPDLGMLGPAPNLFMGSTDFADVGGPQRDMALGRAADEFGTVGGPQRDISLGRAADDFGNVGGPQRDLSLRQTADDFGYVGGPQRDISLGRAASQFGYVGNPTPELWLARAQSGFGNAGDIQRTMGPTDYSQDRTRVEDAIFSRLNPQLDRDRAALESRLVNQGMVRGSEAFNRAMDEANRQANDARMQAVLAGGGEQSRLAQLALQSGQFANQAQAQEYGQALGRGQFARESMGMDNQARLAEAQYGNQAQQQWYEQERGRGEFAQQAAALNNQAQLAEGQFANQAQAQAYQHALARGEFNRESVAQNNQARQAEAQFGNQAQQQAYQQALARGEFGQQATALNNQARLAESQFGNQAQQQAYQQAQARGEFGQQATALNNQARQAEAQYGMDAQAQAYEQARQRGLFGLGALAQNNQTATQSFQNEAQNRAFNNTRANQDYQNRLTELGVRNDVQGRMFDQEMQQANLYNQAQLQQAGANNEAAQMAYQNEAGATQYGNELGQRGFDNSMNLAQQRDIARERALQERLTFRNQPINEIAALMSGGQVTAPQFSQWSPSQVAGTPIGDYVYNTAALKQQNYATQLAQQNAAMGGLFGLGQAGILGAAKFLPWSDRRLKRDIVNIGIRLKNGLKLYAYSYAWEAKRRIGVMADEVETVIPQAVRIIGGFKAVDYSLATAA